MESNTNKNFFSDNYIIDIFMFISAIVSLLATILTVYSLCKHKKLQTLIASLVLYQVKFSHGYNLALQKIKIL